MTKRVRYWEGWFKSAPRPLMKWMTIPLIPYLAVTDNDNLMPILTFAGVLYGMREIGKAVRESNINDNVHATTTTAADGMSDADDMYPENFTRPLYDEERP